VNPLKADIVSLQKALFEVQGTVENPYSFQGL